MDSSFRWNDEDRRKGTANVTIVDPLKFGIGIVFLIAGLAMLFLSRGERGLGQKRQIGGLLVIGAGVFLAVGLGIIRT
jgi:uncharacterized membrane protein